jgi:hypothetical protein
MKLSTFFPATTVAFNAIEGELALGFEPYYNWCFQANALIQLVCHILRAFINLLKVLADLTPLVLLLASLMIPSTFTLMAIFTATTMLGIGAVSILTAGLIIWLELNLPDHALGLTLSLAAIVINPLVFIGRTVTTIICGYEEQGALNTPNDVTRHEEAFDNAWAILGSDESKHAPSPA